MVQWVPTSPRITPQMHLGEIFCQCEGFTEFYIRVFSWKIFLYSMLGFVTSIVGLHVVSVMICPAHKNDPGHNTVPRCSMCDCCPNCPTMGSGIRRGQRWWPAGRDVISSRDLREDPGCSPRDQLGIQYCRDLLFHDAEFPDLYSSAGCVAEIFPFFGRNRGVRPVSNN